MTWLIAFLIWIVGCVLVWLIVAGGAARETKCKHGREDIWCPECNGGNN